MAHAKLNMYIQEQGCSCETKFKLKHGGKIMVVQHNLRAMNSNRMLGLTLTFRQNPQKNYLPATKLTVQQMMQLVFLSLKK